MISYAEAKKILREAGNGIIPVMESLPVKEAVGRICAEDIKAPITLQPFDNSAMDGFAVRIDDLKAARPDGPVVLQILETIAAGNAPSSVRHMPGACVAIMTGAVIPEWAQAVVPVELVTRSPEGGVSFSQTASAGEHIRRAGQDFKSGDPVLRAGTPIGPQHLMALAALGIERLSIYRRPKACFFATGHELAPASEKPLAAGRIYDSNSAYGMAALAAMGVDCTVSRSIPDDETVFLRAVSDALNAGHEMIVSSGGVSAGQFDFVRAALEKLGAVILFHKVAIKPGKPILCARFPDGCFYFGLPGNPASMTAGLRFFVQPFLDAWRRLPEEHPTAAALESTFRKNNKMAVFLKAHVRVDINGSLRASILNGQESFMISPFLSMNAWAVIGESTQEAGKGTLVDVYPLLQKDRCF